MDSRKLISLLNLIEWKVKFEFISQCRGLGYACGMSVETVILAIAQALRYGLCIIVMRPN